MFKGIIKSAEVGGDPTSDYKREYSKLPMTMGGAGAYVGLAGAKKRMRLAAEADLSRHSNRLFAYLSNMLHPKANQVKMRGLLNNVESPLRLLNHPRYGKAARKIALMYTLGLGGLGAIGGSMLKSNALKRKQANDFSSMQ